MINIPLRIGFIGCGQIAALHQLGYINNPKAKLVALCSTNSSDLKKCSTAWNVIKTYSDYHQLLADPDIDLVEILTPHNSHFQIAVDAAKAGKHISLQKVPTMTLDQYDELVTVVKQNKVKFRVYENFRYYAPYLRAMELVKTGKMGQVKTVNQRMWTSYQASKSWPNSLKSLAWRIREDANYSSFTIFDDGFHKHSLAQLFLPSITSVKVWCQHAKFKNIIPLDVPSIVIYETDHPDTYGSWNVSVYPNLPLKSNYYSCDESMEITLDRGIIMIYGCTGNMLTKSLDWMDAKGDWHHEVVSDSDWKYSFISSTQSFIDEILGGSSAGLTAKDARNVLIITLAAVKSLKNAGIAVHV